MSEISMSQRLSPKHPGGWPREYSRLREAWWVLTGQWSLHRAWQRGYDQHTSDDSLRRSRTQAYESACVAASPVLRNALGSIAANTCCDRCQEAALVARRALATTDDYFRPPGTGPQGRTTQPETTGLPLGTLSGAGSIERPAWPAPGCWGPDKP